MTGKIPVSVVVMTRNEAPNLEACLEPLSRFAEVFVVDSHSTDGTAERAAALGAHVVPFRWNGQYPKKKQWCLDHLPFGCPWVLFLDADERLTPALVAELDALMGRGPRHAGYFIEGRPVFLGRRLRFGWGNRKLALFDRSRVRFEPCPDLDIPAMWEVEGHYQPHLDGTAGQLREPLWHDDEKPLFAWFERHNRYSDWEAALAHAGRIGAVSATEKGMRRPLKRLFGRLPLRPVAVLVYGYIVRLGFLDGSAGLHWALARAFYHWQISVKRQALKGRQGASAPKGKR